MSPWIAAQHPPADATAVERHGAIGGVNNPSRNPESKAAGKIDPEGHDEVLVGVGRAVACVARLLSDRQLGREKSVVKIANANVAKGDSSVCARRGRSDRSARGPPDCEKAVAELVR